MSCYNKLQCSTVEQQAWIKEGGKYKDNLIAYTLAKDAADPKLLKPSTNYAKKMG